MNKFLCGVFAFAAWTVAATAIAQPGVTDVIKTRPLRESGVHIQPIGRHFDPTRPEPPPQLPGAGWAGARVKIHVLDPTEVDVVAIVPAPLYAIRWNGAPWSPVPPGIYPGPIPEPFGPHSNNVASVPIIVTLIHPDARLSGINPPASHVEHLFDLVVHAKNTHPRNNSDIDVTMMFSDIWHTRPRDVPGSTVIRFPNSVRMWTYSVFDNPSIWQQFHIFDPPYNSMYRLPEGPPIDSPEGHWVHLPPVTFHNFPGIIPGSQFFAYMVTTVIGLGIEHVPEPVSVALVGIGIACTGMAAFSRRRRLRQ
jgi:hypothetical protein